MTENDFFNIDGTKLPKLTFDEEAGRAMLKHMLSVKEFNDVVVQMKLLSFNHYVEDHLNQKLPRWFLPNTMTELKENLRRLNKEYEHLTPIWLRISAQVDRHIFMLVCTYASFNANLVEEDNIEFVNCPAYVKVFTAPFLATINGHMLGASLLRKFDEGVNGKEAFNGYKNLVEAEGAMTILSTHKYVQDVLGNMNYGKGTIYRS